MTSPAGTDLSRKSGYAFNQIRVNPENPEQIFITGSDFQQSNDGGKTWGGRPNSRARLAISARCGSIRDNPDRMICGSDGGVSLSYDGGRTCASTWINLKLGEVYALTVDMETPYNIYAGLQDHESWRGPSEGWAGSVEGVSDWSTVRNYWAMACIIRWIGATSRCRSTTRMNSREPRALRSKTTRPQKISRPPFSDAPGVDYLRYN